MIIEVKVCENCNHRNPVIAVECEECGYDLTFAFPQKFDDSIRAETSSDNNDKAINEPQKQEIKPGDWEIISTSNETIRSVLGDEIALGRECDLFNEQFNSSNYSSRTHAKIRVYDGRVQVMDASTNGTFVNEKRIPKMEWIFVEEDSTIRFADVSFRIRRYSGAN